MVRKGYRNLSVPDQLVDELEPFVTESRERYVSVAEVVREAVREFLERRRTKNQALGEQGSVYSGNDWP